MPRVRSQRDGVLAWLVGFGPAVAWVAYLVIHYGPSRGYGPVLVGALVSGAGALGFRRSCSPTCPRRWSVSD
jgi:hypothetical protein